MLSDNLEQCILIKFQPGEGLSILQLEKELRTQVDLLAKKKHERMKQLKKLKETDQHLCDVLCTTPYYIPTGSVPSNEQLKELEQHIQTLSEEKVRNRYCQHLILIPFSLFELFSPIF